jgi:hypothetical protein
MSMPSIISAISSYLTGNQIRLPKQRLYIGQATVGIHVSSERDETTTMQIVTFHFPRGANRLYFRERSAISMPKTRVMYPIRNIAALVSPTHFANQHDIPGNVTIAKPRQFLDKTLRREVLCTATKITCCITAPQASTSGNVSAEWTFRRALNRLVLLAIAASLSKNHILSA